MDDPLNPLQILENIPEGVFAINRDCCITYFNQRAEEITGYSRGLAVGRTCYEVFRPEICESKCAIKQSMNTGKELFDHQVIVLDRESNPLSILIQTSPLRDKAGNIIGGLQTFHQIDRPDEDLKEELILFELRKKLGNTRRLEQIYEILPDLAKSDAPVLVQGETGTGKRLLAGAIHRLSGRSRGPFFHVSCRQKSREELTRELLGTSATFEEPKQERKRGILERADQGTIFLDRIGALPYSLQVSIFKAMEKGCYTPAGGEGTVDTDIRIVASTETDLETLVREGTFTENLFYCLNVFKIHVPALRERKKDIRPLAQHILWSLRLEHGKEVRDIDDDVERLLKAYPFPGNLKELRGILEYGFRRAAEHVLRPEDLPKAVCHEATPSEGEKASKRQEGVEASGQREAEKILAALIRNNWNRKRAALDLGMDRTTLWRKMKRIGINYTPPSDNQGQGGG